MKRIVPLVLALLPSVPNAQESDADYFPMAQGNTWIYTASVGGDLEVKIVGFETLEGVECAVVETRGDAGIQKDWIGRDAEGIKIFRKGGAKLNKPVLCAKLPLRSGDRWNATIPQGIVTVSVDFEVSGPEDIAVGGKKYTCMKITQTTHTGRIDIVTETWQAKGVGGVKIVMSIGAQELIYEIKQVRVGAARKGRAPAACAKCKAKLQSGAKFCAECGEKVVDTGEAAIGGTFEESLLARVPDRWGWTSFTFAPDGSATAYRAYEGQRSGKWFVAIGDRAGRKFDEVKFLVVEAGGRVAYAARDGEKWRIVFGETEGEEFDDVGSPIVAPDGKSVAFAARRGAKWLVVAGDRKGEEFDEIPIEQDWGLPPLTFAPDGKSPAYRGRVGDRWFAVAGDKKFGPYEQVGVPVFRPGDGAPAYWARKGGVEFVMIGGQKGPDTEYIGTPFFSPDGKVVACVARKGGKSFVRVGDKDGEPFDDAWVPAFSADGKTVAYEAKRGDKWFVLVGDKKGEEFDWTGKPVFSPDGAIVAYRAKRGGKYLVVVGEKKSKEYDGVDDPIFSPDGKTVVYAAKRGEQRFLVIGNDEGEAYDGVWNPVFSPDGKKVAFGAQSDRDHWWKVREVR